MALQVQFRFLWSARLVVAPATDLIAGMDARAFWHGCLAGTDARLWWQDALTDHGAGHRLWASREMLSVNVGLTFDCLYLKNAEFSRVRALPGRLEPSSNFPSSLTAEQSYG